MSEGTPKELRMETTETVAQVNKYQSLPIKERGIDQATAELYGIKVKTSAQDGVTHLAHYFPVWDEKGRIEGYKKRDLTKAKVDSFSCIGTFREKSKPFGYNTLSKDKWKLIICEGEYDTAFTHRAITSYNRKKGQEERGVHVISIPTGAPNAHTYLLNHTDLLEQYKEVILVFDSDKATPEEKLKGMVRGQDAVENVCLTLHDFSIKYVKLALKDPCEMFEAKRHAELVQDILFNAVEFKPEVLTTFEGTDEEIEDLLTPLPRGVKISFLPELSACMHGVRPHEMTVLLAPTGCGKTSLSKQLGYDLVKSHNWKVANFYLEEPLRIAKQAYVALYNEVRPAKFYENPSIIEKEKIIEARDWMKENMIFYDCDKASILKPESVVRMVKHCAVKGYNAIIFDHLSFVLSGDDSGNERKTLDKLLTDLSLVARGYPVHIWVVAHIKRSTYFNPPKDPETGEVIYPHWFPVKKEDGRSSGAFEQLAHNIICLEPEILDEDGTKGNVRLVQRKNRIWGEERVCDVLTYDTVRGVLG